MKLAESVGVVFVCGGFLVVFQRGLAGLFDVSFTFVTGVGIVALLLGLNYFNIGRQIERGGTDPPDVELRYEATRPGTETDELLADAVTLSRAGVAARREFRDRLHEATTETLLRRGDYPSEAAAMAAVDDGEWTTDPVAAWFLADTTDDAPLSVRLRGVVGGESGFVFAARRTVRAIAAAQRGDHPAAAADDGLIGGVARVGSRLRQRLRVATAGTSSDDTQPETAESDNEVSPGVGATLPGQLGDATNEEPASGVAAEATVSDTRGATGTDHEDAWKLVEGES